jgi:ABC transport permease subunit
MPPRPGARAMRLSYGPRHTLARECGMTTSHSGRARCFPRHSVRHWQVCFSSVDHFDPRKRNMGRMVSVVVVSRPLVSRRSTTSPCARRERAPLWQQRTTDRSRCRPLATAVGRADGFDESEDDKEGDVETLALSILPEQFRERGKSLMSLLFNARAPKYAWRTLSALILGGEVMVRILQGKIHYRNTLDQLNVVGPKSLGVCLLTSAFVGMVFTIQFIREFAKLGLTKSVGGVLALALGRELTPVVTCIIIAGRVGSAFAAELGSQQVSEQTDSLRVLGSDPVDYLITPRVLASMIAAPVLNLLCFTMGMAASVFLAEAVYGVSANVILDSASRAIESWDIIVSMIKAWVCVPCSARSETSFPVANVFPSQCIARLSSRTGLEPSSQWSAAVGVSPPRVVPRASARARRARWSSASS